MKGTSKLCFKPLRLELSLGSISQKGMNKMKTSIKLLTLLFAASLLVGCNGGNGGGGQGGGGSVEGFVFDNAELDTAQVIHTENQASFLNFKKDTGKSYYEITSNDLNGYDAYGNKNVSTPNKVKLTWDYEVPSDKELSKFVVTFGQEEDLSDGLTVNGTKQNEISFYNSYIGTNYFKVTAKFTDDTEESSEIKTFKVEDVAPRNLYAGNMPNVRDMGGRATVAGGRLRQGLIYRGAGNRFDNRSNIDSECENILRNQLKIKTEINVADGTGNNIALSGVNLENCFMAYGAVPYSNLARNSVRIRQIMNILADENNYPIFYHCRIGTDRTGITGMMINGLLGVDFDECLQDYLFSNFAPIDNQRYPHKQNDTNGDDIAKYIDALQELPGSTWQQKVYLALRMIGCPAAQLDKIIDIMTIGPKADFSEAFKVSQDDLTSTVSKTTTSDFKSPATYYAVSNGKSVSYNVTTTAGNKDVIVYLGYTGSVSNGDTSSRLSSYLTLKIDGTEKTIASTRSLWTAGFGSTQQDSRIGYMFNILGNYAFSAGQHTVEVGVKSGTFNIATIGVADR